MIGTVKSSPVAKRPPSPADRPCDKCGEPMIGIMVCSGVETPRKICSDCGGNSLRVS